MFHRDELEKKDREIERLKHQTWDLERRLEREMRDSAKMEKEIHELRHEIGQMKEVCGRFTRIGSGQIVTYEVLEEELDKLNLDAAVAVSDAVEWRGKYEALWAAVPDEFKVAKKLMEAQ